MNLNNWIKDCHQTAVEKGWWNKERPKNEIYMLFITEIAEASEEARKKDTAGLPIYQLSPSGGVIPFGSDEWDNLRKPEGEAIELADCLIRMGDYMGKIKLDLESMLSCSSLKTIKTFVQAERFSLQRCYPTQTSPLAHHFFLVSSFTYVYDEKDILMDSFLKILDYFAKCNWSVEQALEVKMKYNAGRGYRHGGKLA